MRTPEEIKRQIDGLKEERQRLPEYSAFNDNNWVVIDVQIAILERKKSYDNDYKDEKDDRIESAAYNADYWLNSEGDDVDDLF